MTKRSPESMLHELDYWRCVIVDVREINDRVADVADRLGLATLHLALTHDVERAVIQSNELMDSLAKMDEPLSRMLSLIEGRQLALEAEKVA